MTAVSSRLAPISQDGWLGPAYTSGQIQDQITYWREHLIEANAGSNLPTRPECLRQLDRWLDERLELRGR